MAKHPKDHNCPEGQHYDEENGKCVNNESTDVSNRDRTASNLNFKKREVM